MNLISSTFPQTPENTTENIFSIVSEDTLFTVIHYLPNSRPLQGFKYYSDINGCLKMGGI